MSKTARTYRLTDRCLTQLATIQARHALASETGTIEWLVNREGMSIDAANKAMAEDHPDTYALGGSWLTVFDEENGALWVADNYYIGHMDSDMPEEVLEGTIDDLHSLMGEANMERSGHPLGRIPACPAAFPAISALATRMYEDLGQTIDATVGQLLEIWSNDLADWGHDKTDWIKSGTPARLRAHGGGWVIDAQWPDGNWGTLVDGGLDWMGAWEVICAIN